MISKLDINAQFYTYMKKIYSNNYKIKKSVLEEIIVLLEESIENGIEIQKVHDNFIEILGNNINGKGKENKIAEYTKIVNLWNSALDIKVFLLSAYMIYIKEIISFDFVKKIEPNQLLHPLSLEYDNESVMTPYKRRVSAIITANNICSYYLKMCERPSILDTVPSEIDERIINLLTDLKDEIYLNSIFGLIINESINQSIKSESGGNFEDRIKNLLIEIGVPEEKIEKFNHDTTGSIEHDFLFKIYGKTFGISAKRTFRERYKQYVNLLENKNADILITITLGTDLTLEKAKTILGFGVYIFVSPEIYNSHKYLQELEGVYSAKELKIKLLKKMAKN